ncbi:MAG TPA: hypothetical protein VK914_00415 [bacterium]|jgi:hypothetical protein|nr:hypothetical protein [bacterium]
MKRPHTRIPRLPEPLPAVLAGAGFFLCWAAYAGFGPFGAGTASAAPAPSEIRTAERVLGAPSGLSAGAKVDGLISDLAWLRSQGAGPIVLEAWLDEEPQSDARAFEDELRARFEALPPGRARSRALQVLSATAAQLDASGRLASALKAAQPLLLPFQVEPGGGGKLPDEILRQSYEVSLRGDAETLPSYRILRPPFGGLLGSTGLAALPPAAADPRAVVAVVGVQGHWINAVGLEAARLALGLPPTALRFRWSKGVLNSLELADRRHAMDGEGRLILPEDSAALPSVSMDSLRRDPGQLRGETIFFRPWPGALGESQSFDEQARVFTVLTQAEAPATQPLDPRSVAYCLAAALASLLACAFAPAPLGASLMGAALAFTVRAFHGGPDLPQALAYWAAVLLIGLGWRFHRYRGMRLKAERMCRGLVADAYQVDWSRRLATGAGALPVAYAAVGPLERMRGPLWEAWMARWGVLMDPGGPADGLGLILAEPDAAEAMASALLDLRRQMEGIKGALSLGTLALKLEWRLGAAVWETQGPPKAQCLELFCQAQPGQILLSQKDFPAFADIVEIRPLVGFDGMMAIAGPKTDLWKTRP